MSQWTHVLTPAEIAAHHALIASIDPAFSVRDREYWEKRTEGELRSLMFGAWNCNDADAYQIARSYLALKQTAH